MRVSQFPMILICVLALFASTAFAAERLPVPDEAKQKEAREILMDAYGDEIKNKDDEVQKELAGKLLNQADDPANDATMRYVLLKMAAITAADAGDAETALSAVEQLGKQYKEKTGPIELRILERSYKAAKEPEEYLPVAEGYMALVTKAIQKDDFESADEAAKQAKYAARKAKDKDLYDQTKDLTKTVRDAEKQYKAVEAAFKTLEENADDSDANLAVGRYLCFIKGNWDEGLVHLEKGSDKTLAELAAKDVGTPEDPKELLALADAWYDLGEKENKESPEQKAMFGKARKYYQKSLPKLSGVAKVRVEKRVQALEGYSLNQTGKQNTASTDSYVAVMLGTFSFHKGSKEIPPWGVAVVPDGRSIDASLAVARKKATGAYSFKEIFCVLKGSIYLPEDGIYKIQLVQEGYIDGNTLPHTEEFHEVSLTKGFHEIMVRLRSKDKTPLLIKITNQEGKELPIVVKKSEYDEFIKSKIGGEEIEIIYKSKIKRVNLQ